VTLAFAHEPPDPPVPVEPPDPLLPPDPPLPLVTPVPTVTVWSPDELPALPVSLPVELPVEPPPEPPPPPSGKPPNSAPPQLAIARPAQSASIPRALVAIFHLTQVGSRAAKNSKERAREKIN
jgi:hypothetical protein